MEETLIGLAIFAVSVVLFIVPILTLVRLSQACRGIRELKEQLERLERSLSGRAEVRPTEPVRPAVGVRTEVVRPSPVAAPPVLTPVRPPATPPAPPSHAPEPTPFERAVAKAWNWLIIGEEFRKPGESWEYAVATNWLLRVGIVVVLAGVAFFLKFSIERGLLGPLGRVALCLAAGISLIAAGVQLLFKKYHLLGQGLSGAGFAILYFAFYAASRLYHLLPNAAAFALMIGVTVAAGVLSVSYRSVLIAVLGLVGGYATPVMMGGAHGQPLFFYGYVLLLTCGVLGVSLVRRWPVLSGIGMLAAYGLALLFCGHHRGAVQLREDFIFLSAIHVLYLLSVSFSRIRNGAKTGVSEWVAVLLNAGIYWMWAFLLFRPVFGKEETGVISLCLAAIYVALAYVWVKRNLEDKAAIGLFIALAAVFLAMSPVLMLTGEWLTLAWCLQALAMLALARLTGQAFLSKMAAVVFVLASVRGLLFDLHRLYDAGAPWCLVGAEYWKQAGLRLLTYGALPASLAAAWRITKSSSWAARILGLVLVQVWLYVTLESDLLARVYAPGFRGGAVTLVWTLFAFALLVVGIRRSGKWLRWCGLILFASAVTKLLLSDLEGLSTLFRIVAFLSIGVLLVLGSYVYLRFRDPADQEAGRPANE